MAGLPPTITSWVGPTVGKSGAPTQSPANLSLVKCDIKPNFLRRNTSLKHLTLFLLLDKDEVHDILHSLEDNHTLEKLELFTRGHLVPGGKRKTDKSTSTEQSLANPSGVKGDNMHSMHTFLRRNTSLKHLTHFTQLDEVELHDIVHSLKDNHTLERLELPPEMHRVFTSMSIEEPRICKKDTGKDDFNYMLNTLFAC